MAHWAEVDDKNTVIRVLVGDNNDPNGDEGYGWLIENLGGNWVQTSYNGRIRARFAGIGYTYDEQRDLFIAPKPYPSWILDEQTTEWIAPIPKPTTPGIWVWDEESLSWKEMSDELPPV